MTTAHRPTWNPVKGGGTSRDKGTTLQFSSRDLPSYKILKHRQPGQLADENLSKEQLKEDLELKEKIKKVKPTDDEEEQYELKELRQEPEIVFDSNYLQLDADEESKLSDQNDEDSTDDDDETEELLKQLEAIKKDREMERKKHEMEEQKKQEFIRKEQLLSGNPLLNVSEDYSLQRKWTDDTVFKNCAKGISEKPTKRFINDTIRSDFHRKFMKKFFIYSCFCNKFIQKVH